MSAPLNIGETVKADTEQTGEGIQVVCQRDYKDLHQRNSDAGFRKSASSCRQFALRLERPRVG